MLHSLSYEGLCCTASPLHCCSDRIVGRTVRSTSIFVRFRKSRSRMHAKKSNVATAASKWILLFFALLTTLHVTAQQELWQKVPIPPLHKFTPQEPTRIQLSNGMVIML